jgi:tRNA modification GTPase
VSGKDAVAICNRICRPARKSGTLSEQPANTVVFGSILREGRLLDEALATVFRAPRSYTGEDTVEISCHGSVFIQQELLKLLMANGCRMAAAGEFTQRAFLNGKLDLSQAEAVGDLIASSSAAAHRMAMRQMRGEFSRQLSELRRQLLKFTSLIELELDFSEEDVEFADRNELKQLAGGIEAAIRRLVTSFDTGNAIKNGIPVAIAGATNAGKSTLLNRLLKDERAIVSDVHGTTRDSIEDTVTLEGLLFRFIDTAGIRRTDDAVERLGVERTFRKIEQASIVLWVIDLTADAVPLSEEIAERCRNKRLMLVLNKSDRLTEDALAEKTAYYRRTGREYTVISAKSDADVSALERRLTDIARFLHTEGDDVVVSNLRHREALQKTAEALRRVIDGLNAGVSGEFLAQDIRECMHFLGEITGEITTDEVLGNIFGNFCIGK